MPRLYQPIITLKRRTCFTNRDNIDAVIPYVIPLCDYASLTRLEIIEVHVDLIIMD